jgi:hypothetical protein
MYTALITYSYAFVAVAIAFIFLREIGGAALQKCRPKTVGPTYWGVYHGRSLQESSEMRTVALPKDSDGYGMLAGSERYSKGKPVKSARV